MPTHGSHAARLIVSRENVKDGAANTCRLQRLQKIQASQVFGAVLRFTKTSNKAIRSDSIKHRESAFGATPGRHHVMPCERLPNAPIHGNLLVGWADILCV
jgi:hypothetical protein